MKVKIRIVAVVAVFFSVMLAGTSFAAIQCANVAVAGVATTSTAVTPSGMSVRLIPTATCGTWAAGSNVKFFLSTEGTDRTLAIILTAMSLGKNLWVDVSGSVDGSIINVVNMTN